jgi:hypothetical protein
MEIQKVEHLGQFHSMVSRQNASEIEKDLLPILRTQKSQSGFESNPQLPYEMLNLAMKLGNSNKSDREIYRELREKVYPGEIIQTTNKEEDKVYNVGVMNTEVLLKRAGNVCYENMTE